MVTRRSFDHLFQHSPGENDSRRFHNIPDEFIDEVVRRAISKIDIERIIEEAASKSAAKVESSLFQAIGKEFTIGALGAIKGAIGKLFGIAVTVIALMCIYLAGKGVIKL